MGEYGWLVAFAAAAGGTLLTLWAQVRGFWSQLSSRVIVRSLFTEEAITVLQFFLTQQCQVSRWGAKSYAGTRWYVPKRKRMEVVPMESLDDTTRLYWYGYQPLFVKMTVRQSTRVSGNTDSYSMPGLTITTLRGFKSLEQILIEATKKFNDDFNAADTSQRRFAVRRVASYRNDIGDSAPAAAAVNSQDLKQLAVRRLLMHSIEELGDYEHSSPEGTFDGLIETEIMGELRQRIEWWLADREWYESKRLAWRDSWILHGIPGCGKTSLVRSLAKYYDLPILTADMTQIGNNDLQSLFASASASLPAIVLLEDIDAVFDGREVKVFGGGRGFPHDQPRTHVTFEGMLEVLDGVDRHHGVITVMTTNHLEKLDPALIRPGRMNFRREVRPFTPAEQRQYIQFMLGEHADRIVIEPERTPASLFAECVETIINIKNQEFAGQQQVA